MAPVLMLFLEAGMCGACGANRSDGVERIQCRGSAGPLGGRTSIDVDAGSKGKVWMRALAFRVFASACALRLDVSGRHARREALSAG